MTPDEILDNKTPEPEAKETQPQATSQNAADKMRKNFKGTLKLTFPLRAASADITELQYDFCDLTSLEMIEALDKDSIINMFGISNRQALFLFAATAEKCNEKVDAMDVVYRLSAADVVKAVQLAKLFYAASFRAEKKNTSHG